MKKILLLLYMYINLAATTYYVDATNGNDLNDGTSPETAWQTIAKVNSMNFLPGDEIFFKRGEIWKERMLFPSSGEEGNQIVVGAFGVGDRPIIDGNSESANNYLWTHKGNSVYGTFTNFQNSTCFNVVQGNILLTKMIANNLGTFSDITAPGQWVWNSNNDSLFVRTLDDASPIDKQVNFSKFAATIHLGWNSTTARNYIIFQDIEVHGSYFNIEIRGKGIIVRNCKFFGAFGEAIKIYADYPTNPELPSHNYYAEDVLIENNEITMFGGWGIDNTGGKNVTISKNNIYMPSSNHGYNVDGNSYAGGILTKNYSLNTIIENNRIHDISNLYFGAIVIGGTTSTGWKIEAYNTIVRYNLIYNVNTVPRSSMPSYLLGLFGARNTFIYNNTITNCIINENYNVYPLSTLLFASISKNGFNDYNNVNVTISNNIFNNNVITNKLILTENKKGDLTNLIMQHNLYDTVNYSFKYQGNTFNDIATWQNAGNDSNSIIGKPHFVNPNNNFELTYASLAINNGIELDNKFDIIHNPIIGIPDIGAFEYQTQLNENVEFLVKVFLSGSIHGTYMINSLQNSNKLPKLQPFANSPWNYAGNEYVSSFPQNIVDWVLLELRNEPNYLTERRAALLKTDGTVVDFDGVSPVSFENVTSGSYYIIIEHRNHLSIMSRDKVELSSEPILYDFTTSLDKAFGENSMVQLENGFFSMISGDSNADGVINILDYQGVANQIYKNTYNNCDLDMNGTVNVLDYAQIYKNILKKSRVPTF